MAQQAAQGMSAKVYNELIQQSRERLFNYTRKLIGKYIPKILLTDKAAEYLEVTKSIKFVCEPNAVLVSGLESLPSFKAINIPRSEFDQVVKLKKELEQNSIKSYSFYRKCETTLLTLKTISRVKKEFPEAIQFLPKDSVETPDKNIEYVKKLLEV